MCRKQNSFKINGLQKLVFKSWPRTLRYFQSFVFIIEDGRYLDSHCVCEGHKFILSKCMCQYWETGLCIVDFSLFVGFIDNKKNKEYPQLHPLNWQHFISFAIFKKLPISVYLYKTKYYCTTSRPMGWCNCEAINSVNHIFCLTWYFIQTFYVFHGGTLGQTYRIIGPPGTGDSVLGSKWLMLFSQVQGLSVGRYRAGNNSHNASAMLRLQLCNVTALFL